MEPATPKPLLVFFPMGGSLTDSAALCRQLCAEAGVVVLAASYRRPSGPARDALQDAVMVTQWAMDHAANLEGDPSRLLVGGQAVGGSLAAAVAGHARYEGWPPIVGQVLLAPDVEDPLGVLREALAAATRGAA